MLVLITFPLAVETAVEPRLTLSAQNSRLGNDASALPLFSQSDISICQVRTQVDGYDTYEQYLDSLVSEEDHHYLDDEEMARCIAELGYRYAILQLVAINITDCM